MKHCNKIIYFALFCVNVLPILFTFTPVNSLRILAIAPISAKSHWNFASSVVHALRENGHNVTVFTPFPEKDQVNYTEIDVSDVIPKMSNMETTDELFKAFCKPTVFIPLVMNMSRYFCHLIYENVQMVKILNDTRSNFDVVMTEFSASECVSYPAAKMNLPVIYLIPSPLITHTEYDFIGHVPNPALTPNINAHYMLPRTFFQRLDNFIFLVYNTLSIKYMEWTLRQNDPQLYDSVNPIKPSIVFSNTHYISEVARPLPPNVIQIGGVHLKPPVDLPNDVLKFIEESPNGVIYFTFGSVVKMSTLPDHIQNAFREALAQVPQRVLWKYEGEMKDKPKNVMIKKWFPQRDILMHPKVKLFISHGGISGIYETVDAAVPVLGFPIFYDQHRNIANLVDAGMAISMELMSVSKDTFSNAILELINNEKYSTNAKIAAERFKDRPMSPEKSIVYWTEYVHRHKGAPHLKSHALSLAWYQYFLLDVIAVLLVCVFVVLFASYKILKIVYKYSLTLVKDIKKKSE